jgi:hypothetical protein
MATKDISVVMAHGGWADGSSWARVVTGLAAGHLHLHLPDLGASRASAAQRGLGKGAQNHARLLDRHAVCFRRSRDRGTELSAGWTRNVYLLPHCLSEARSAWRDK